VRVRMGVNPQQPIDDMVSYLLGRFRASDQGAVDSLVSEACEAVHVILREGLQKAMNRFNRRVSTQPS